MAGAARIMRRVAVLGGMRTAFARQNTHFAEASSRELLTVALTGLVGRFRLHGMRLGEVASGAVLKHPRDFNLSREAVLSSGLSPETPAFDVQQACATSMQAAAIVSAKIAVGQIDVGVAGGVDSSSDAPLALREPLRKLVLKFNRTRGSLARMRILSRFRPAMLLPSIPNINEHRTGLSMGEHCELMVKRWGVGRREQDALAYASHMNGLRAWREGFYAPLVVHHRGLEMDNNLRATTSLDKLARLQPAFDKTSGRGTLTAGNSTPLTDGAATVLLASEEWAQVNGHAPLAWLTDAETAAVDYFSDKADGLLMAPVRAVPRLLRRNQLTLQDFDFYEIHEAFAGQVLCNLRAWESEEYCLDVLGLDAPLGSINHARLNVNGGSVGLGHPFAATGARILAGAAKQLALHRAATGRSGRTLISVCAAGGVGVTAILEG